MTITTTEQKVQISESTANNIGELLKYLWQSCEEYGYIRDQYEDAEAAIAGYEAGELSNTIAGMILQTNADLFGVDTKVLIAELY